MFAPQIQGPETSRDMVTTFGGYNHNLRIADGLPTSQWGNTPPMEWYDEENLSTDHYPVMSPSLSPKKTIRPGSTNTLEPTGALGVTSFVTIDGVEHYLYIDANGHFVMDGQYLVDTRSWPDDRERQYILMGTYLIVFPDRMYININKLDPLEWGYIDAIRTYGNASASTSSPNHKVTANNLQFTPCDLDGNAVTGYTTSDTAPANPSDGDLWLDTSENVHIFKRYSASNAMWLGVSDVYVLVQQAAGSGEDFPLSDAFSEGDGINLNYTDTSVQTDVSKGLKGSHVVQKVAGNGLILIGVIDEPFTTVGEATISRSCPDMDYIIECNNRLWGCKYGIVDDKNINELYCSKLGDFKNWEVYEGLSTDSWRGSVGAEGAWTGAAAYNGYPTFFKEDSIHKVYISSTGAHQVVMTSADGVSEGSWRSMKIINGVLFYLSRFGVMAYTGTLPARISEQIPFLLKDGVGGVLNKQYYLSAKTYDDAYVTFIYDTELQVWHKVSPHRAIQYTTLRDRLIFDSKEPVLRGGYLNELTMRDWGTEETVGDWYAVSGVIGFAYPDNKYLSRFVFRADLAKDSWCELFIEYDSDGKWLSKGRMYRPGLQSFVLPVMPRRCDHCRIKLVGHGDFRLYSISKILEVGSDY